MNKPLLSIITVCYNDADNLRKTIESIKNQSYKHIEHIVIDGASTDNTSVVIKEYKQFISTWISEPDDGLYDAMNKGLKMATGDYVWFVNAGDIIYKEDVAEIIMLQLSEAEIYYGKALIINQKGCILGERRLKPPDNLSWKKLKYGMLVSHQAFIVKRSKAPYYNLHYRFSADFDWMIRALKQSREIINTNKYMIIFQDGGRTKQTILPGLKERFLIMAKNFGIIPTFFRHFYIAWRFFYFWLQNKWF